MKEEIANVRQREADDEKVDIQELLLSILFIGCGLLVQF